jgi:hypothetical protein
MSRKLSLWLLAVSAVVIAFFWVQRERPSEVPEAEVAAAAASVVPVAAASGRGTATTEARMVARSGEEAGLAGLPPEDAEWVLDAVARTESARALSERDREALIAQLSLVRRHAVLERTEPMAVEPEVLP